MLAALGRILQPIVDIAMAQGLSYGDLDSILRRCVIRSALAEGATTVSAVHARTGLHRREVTRLSRQLAELPPPHPTVPVMLFDKWTGDAELLDRKGYPRELPRVGRRANEISFESLVASISRDVRPRAILDALVSRGLAEVDSRDRVSIRKWVEAAGANTPAVGMEATLAPLARTVAGNLSGRQPRLPAFSMTGMLSEAGVQRMYDRLSPKIVRLLHECHLALAAAEKAERRIPATGKRSLHFGYFVNVDPPLPQMKGLAPLASRDVTGLFRIDPERKAPAARKAAARKSS